MKAQSFVPAVPRGADRKTLLSNLSLASPISKGCLRAKSLHRSLFVLPWEIRRASPCLPQSSSGHNRLSFKAEILAGQGGALAFSFREVQGTAIGSLDERLFFLSQWMMNCLEGAVQFVRVHDSNNLASPNRLRQSFGEKVWILLFGAFPPWCRI